MPFLIDGHNLIGKLPGIQLDQLDDERQLLELLRQFARRDGRRVTVYFDRGSMASEDPRPQGGVEAHFVRSPRTADEAISQNLERLGGEAKNWTVVSSDRKVQAAARRAGARRLTSEAFAEILRTQSPDDPNPEKPPPPSGEEVERWLRMFQRRTDSE